MRNSRYWQLQLFYAPFFGVNQYPRRQNCKCRQSCQAMQTPELSAGKHYRVRGGAGIKIYTITGGVNGVGKSSLSGVLSAESTDLGIIIDTDKLIAELEGDRIKGGKLAIERIEDCLKKV